MIALLLGLAAGACGSRSAAQLVAVMGADAGPDAGASTNEGPDGAATAGRDDGGPADARPAPAFCPSVGWRDPRGIALVVATDQDVTFVRADGRRTVVHRFGGRQNAWIRLAGNDRFVMALQAEDGRRFEAVLLDAEGALRSRHTFLRGAATTVYNIHLGKEGSGAIGLAPPPSVAILADGTVHELPSLLADDAPADSGWLPAHRWDEVERIGRGFVRAGSDEFKRLTRPVATKPYPHALWVGDRYVYLGVGDGRLVLVEESPTETRGWPLDLPDDDRTRLFRDGGRILVSVDRILRWIWRFGSLAPVALNGFASRDGFTEVSERFALSGGDGVPRWVIDLETAQVRALAPVPAGVGNPWELRITANGPWFVGTLRARPVWWVNASSAEVVPLDLGFLGPLRPFEQAQYCAGPAVPLVDGQLAVGLHDGSLGGLFAGAAGSGPWRRLGRPMTRVGAVNAVNVGASWLVQGVDLENTFCPQPPMTWAPPPSGEPEPLPGASLQIVSPSRDPIVPSPSARVDVHASGLCALIDGAPVDLGTGERYEGFGRVAALLWR